MILMMHSLNTQVIHSSWGKLVHNALDKMDPHYLLTLQKEQQWLPGPDKIFNAFSIPLSDTRYILFGESPYPRAHSANGYAFWDNNVSNLWSDRGLSKTVNRATSLRNMIKMMLVAANLLNPDTTTQEKIAAIDKSHLVHTMKELFTNFLSSGFLLLNASLVYRPNLVQKDAQAWRIFIESLLAQLAQQQARCIKVLLFGRLAKALKHINHGAFAHLEAEHPYNLSFIQNKTILNFFRPLNLLVKR